MHHHPSSQDPVSAQGFVIFTFISDILAGITKM